MVGIITSWQIYRQVFDYIILDRVHSHPVLTIPNFAGSIVDRVELRWGHDAIGPCVRDDAGAMLVVVARAFSILM